jgi:hypothetical protein
MIPVEFKMAPGTNIEAEVRFYAKSMPWLKYLMDHCIHYSINDTFEVVTYQTVVRIEFDLPPEKETFYHLKYR